MQKIIILLVVVVCSTALAEIDRPCAVEDYKCISDNLAANSNCQKRVKGSLPNKYFVNEFRYESPYPNVSHIDRNLIVKNHDKCFVSEFFFDNDTDKAVLTIDCPNLDLESDRVLIQHRSKKEDSHYNYHIHAIYEITRFTVNLNRSTQMDLCKAQVFTDEDQKTAKFLTEDLSLFDISERASFYYWGYPVFIIFIDNIICNYGCHPLIL